MYPGKKIKITLTCKGVPYVIHQSAKQSNFDLEMGHFVLIPFMFLSMVT